MSKSGLCHDGPETGGDPPMSIFAPSFFVFFIVVAMKNLTLDIKVCKYRIKAECCIPKPRPYTVDIVRDQGDLQSL
jgi:hypothetical protein